MAFYILAKIAVFLFFVLIVCIILGTVMYMIEGAENGFTNITVITRDSESQGLKLN